MVCRISVMSYATYLILFLHKIIIEARKHILTILHIINTSIHPLSLVNMNFKLWFSIKKIPFKDQMSLITRLQKGMRQHFLCATFVLSLKIVNTLFLLVEKSQDMGLNGSGGAYSNFHLPLVFLSPLVFFSCLWFCIRRQLWLCRGITRNLSQTLFYAD